MKKSIAALAAFGALGLGLSVASPASAHSADRETEHETTPPPSQTLAEILLSDSAGDDANGFDKNAKDFDIVTQAALLYPDLVAAVSNPDLELTVFLPNDGAFRKLVKDLTGQRPRSESDIFAAVAGLGLDTVRTVLTYHVIAGSAIDYDTARQSDGAVLTTLQGSTLTVDVRGGWCRSVRLIDNDPDARDPMVVSPNVGGEATNGFAHGIDRVLRPVNL
ncbi:MAG TPA: fasciclin domain-containing protein [Ilumatobacteraceae bacterium]|nr:fasciclin domain-containing protein [Ilumatobacteraceae bacterium]